MKTISIVFGTRPEVIKMASIIKEFSKRDDVKLDICFTGQHKEMVYPLLEFFEIDVNHSLEIMRKNQSLSSLNSIALEKMDEYFMQTNPDLVFVQGDTTTAMSAAVAAFYKKIPIGHIEAGLRTHNIYSPFPEEFNRKVISQIANLHFAPTETAKENLLAERFEEKNVYLTGNTVIDTLFHSLDFLKQKNYIPKELTGILNSNKTVLITGHRRENFGTSFENMCLAIKNLAEDNPDINFVYPVHLNPQVQEPVNRLLQGIRNIFLLPPLNYIDFIYLMNNCYCILTDSGGIQEEAAALNKPVLVMRENTERNEGVLAGTAVLVGTSTKKIMSTMNELLQDKIKYEAMAKAPNPFGDGRAADRIAKITMDNL